MSEVKRYIVGLHRLTDAAGQPAAVKTEALVVLSADFDAQRLRADTAEAEVSRLRETATLAAKVGAPNFHSMKREIAAAEQRIADQNSLLEEMAIEMTLAISDSQIRAAMTSVGRTRFLQILQAYNARIDAALNQKSEGESHADL